MEVEDGEGR